MSDAAETIVLKKYANRRLYNTATSAYVTLKDIAAMVRANQDFVVQDSKTGEDLTRSILTQVILENEADDGPSLLPTSFLRQLIKFYGDSLQGLVPSYLEMSLGSFMKDQNWYRSHMGTNFAEASSKVMEAMAEQARRNFEMYAKSMEMVMLMSGFGKTAETKSAPDQPAAPAETSRDDEIDKLRNQLEQMQAALSALSSRK